MYCYVDTCLIRSLSFELLLQRHPSVTSRFSRVMARRLQQVMSTTTSKPIPRAPFIHSNIKTLTIAIVPVSSQLDMNNISIQLCTALSSHGRTLHLNPFHVNRLLGADTTAHLEEWYHRGMIHITSQYMSIHIMSNTNTRLINFV